MVSLARRSAAVLSLAVAVGCSGAASAQQTLGAVNGTVTDSSGSLLPGVTVTVTDEATQVTRSATSNSTGVYGFVNLPIGAYALIFQRCGFATARFPGIRVQADRTVTLPAQLALGSVSSSVTVEASPLLNAVDTTNGYVLEHAQIEAIPLSTGSFTGVAILSPGVNAELTGGIGANSGLGNSAIWANGQRDTTNSFQLNGVDGSNLFSGKNTSQVGFARVVNNTGEGLPGAGGVIQSAASATAILTKGRHSITFGGSFSYTQLNVRDQRTGKGPSPRRIWPPLRRTGLRLTARMDFLRRRISRETPTVTIGPTKLVSISQTSFRYVPMSA